MEASAAVRLAARTATTFRSVFGARPACTATDGGRNEVNRTQPMATSAYTLLCSSLVFPLHERVKRHDSTARRRALEESQWWSRERIERYRLARLRDFLVRVGSSVPYYKDLFARSAFDPQSVRTLSDLRGIPFLTKAIVRTNV